jgi:hypothetical protein
MPQHPTQGVPKSKPRLPKIEGNGKPDSKAEIQKLSKEYLRHRNQQMSAKAEMAQMLAAERRGELIPKREVLLRAGWLLTGLRAQLLSFPHSLPRLLVGKTEHEMLVIIKEQVYGLLTDLAAWPRKFASSDWFNQIDEDLLPAGERNRLRPATGAEVKAEQERVKRRRARKAATMRKLRAEERAS